MPLPLWGTQASADEVTFPTIHSKAVATELRPDLTSGLLAYYGEQQLTFSVSFEVSNR